MDDLLLRIEVLEKKVLDYDRYFHVLNDHSIYLSECVEKLSKGFNLLKDLLLADDKNQEEENVH